MTPAALKSARYRLGLTQREAAELCGVAARTYQRMEGGSRPVTQRVAEVVEGALAAKGAGDEIR